MNVLSFQSKLEELTCVSFDSFIGPAKLAKTFTGDRNPDKVKGNLCSKYIRKLFSRNTCRYVLRS